MVPHQRPRHEGILYPAGRPTAISRGEGGLLLDCGGEQRAYDGVFIFRPTVASDRLLPGLQMDGPFIRVDRRMATSMPRVFACGDCTGKPLQIAKAVGEGNIAAISAAEELSK